VRLRPRRLAPPVSVASAAAVATGDMFDLVVRFDQHKPSNPLAKYEARLKKLADTDTDSDTDSDSDTDTDSDTNTYSHGDANTSRYTSYQRAYLQRTAIR